MTAGSLDAALVRTLGEGSYTVQARDLLNRSGAVLVEVYDADASGAAGRLVNLSTRTLVGAGESKLTAGFVVRGPGTVRVLIRGAGGSLAAFGVEGVLADPQIEVFNNAAQVIASNNDWGGSATSPVAVAAAQAGAFPLTSNRDAALLLDLADGAYTVEMTPFGGGASGQGLIEIYAVPTP